jgi:hypothetical protein
LSVVAVAAATQLAEAGSFGGFSTDEKAYLDGTDQICAPLGKGDAVPSCKKIDARARAAAGFRKPAAVRGKGAFSAAASGTKLTIRGSDGRLLRTWTSMDVISRVDAVYVSPKARLLAVEYQTRSMGRVRSAVIGFELPKAKHTVGASSGTATGTSRTTGTGPAGNLAIERVKRDPALAKKLGAAQKLLERRRYPKALQAFQLLAKSHMSDAAVVYGLAAARAGKGDAGGAVSALRELVALKHPEVPIWLVEARTDKAFDKLRRNKDFRLVIGLDPGQRTPSAYERAVGTGGKWEQPERPCAEPKVELVLSRAKQTFRLTISSRCNGVRDRTRLSGKWGARGTSQLSLIFPNPGADDEVFECKLSSCETGDETCMVCGEGTDMGFTLRPVRR